MPYSLVHELCERLDRPGAEPSGLLRGRLSDDAIVLEPGPATAGANAIGIFRAQPGGWATLNPADRKKLKAAGLSRGVLLVIRTLAQRPWSATLFTVEPEGAPAAETPLAEFPWDEYLLRNGWLVDLAPPVPPQPRLLIPPRRRGRYWLLALAVLLLASGGVAAWRWPSLLPWPLWKAEETSAPPPPTPVPDSAQPLALRVVREAQDLDVSWSHASDAIRQAGSGTLTIRNGAATRVLDGKPQAESVAVLGFDTAPALTPPPLPAVRAVRPAGPASATRTEAVPINRVAPVLSRDVLAQMRAANRRVTVSVEVSIDGGGQVTEAKVVSAAGLTGYGSSAIRQACLTAARRWRFHAATDGGSNVPSQMTLLFTF